MVSESDFDEGDDDDEDDEEEFGDAGVSATIYLCSFSGCEKMFSRKDRLLYHLSVHEGKKPYICSHKGCDKAYTRPAGLKRHTNNCHDVKKYNQVYSCTEDNCDKKFNFLHNLHRHVKRVHEEALIKCSHCTKTFKKRQQFRIHEFQHTGIKPFKCSVDGCSKDFLLPSKLKAHMKCHKGYKCTSKGCEATFEKWTLLQKHMKLDHVPVHKCSTCSQVFATAVILRSHEKTHGLEREIFACPKDDCSRFYFFERNLRQHMKSAHEGAEGEPAGFACSHVGCHQKFKHKSSLDRHLKRHASGAITENKPKMTRKYRKRRSTAAHLSGYSATKEEEMAILNPDSEAAQPVIPQVVLVRKSLTPASSCDHNIPKISSKASKSSSKEANNDKCDMECRTVA